MKPHQYSQPFSDPEVQMLQKKANSFAPKLILSLLLFFAVIAVTIVAFIGIDSFTIVWLAILGMMLSAGVYYFFKTRAAIQKDLAGGLKMIRQDRLEDKLEKSSDYSSTYHCRVSGEEFEISFTQWKHLQPGQWIEIHFAPHSRYVFTVAAMDYPVRTDDTP